MVKRRRRNACATSLRTIRAYEAATFGCSRGVPHVLAGGWCVCVYTLIYRRWPREAVEATRDPRRPKRFVVVSQGQRGHPATGSRPRTPSYKFTSTKLLPTYRPFCHAPGEPSVAATCKPGGRQGLAGAGRRRRALSACTSCIFDRIGQIAQPAGHRLGSAVWGVARLRGSVV